MSNIKVTLTMVLALLSTAVAHFISKECQAHETSIICQCFGNQEFYLPEDYNYSNTTKVNISSCSTAKLAFPHLLEAKHMRKFIIQNIRKQLNIELSFGTRNILHFELANIKRIPLISSEAFGFENIGRLEIRNVFIESFQEHFVKTNVNDLVLVNVTIAHLEGFNFTEKGKTLKIINCEFRKISTSLKFYFSNVTIVNSTFTMQTPGLIDIDSDYAIVEGNVLFNISMALVARNFVRISRTCGDGRTSLRLHSNNTESSENRLPNSIVYSFDNSTDESESIVQYDNVICIAGNCKCPKIIEKNGSQKTTISMEIFLIWLTHMIFQRNIV